MNIVLTTTNVDKIFAYLDDLMYKGYKVKHHYQHPTKFMRLVMVWEQGDKVVRLWR